MPDLSDVTLAETHGAFHLASANLDRRELSDRATVEKDRSIVTQHPVREPISYADRLPPRRELSGPSARASAAVIAGLAIFFIWASRSPYRDNVTLDAPPVQTDVDLEPWTHLDATISPRARFEIEAILIHKKRYLSGRESDYAPWDLGVGWGSLADGDTIEQFEFFHYNRFFYWRIDEEPPIPLDELGANMANIHAIPADRAVRRALRRLDDGDRIRLRGYLVDVAAPDGWAWTTSLSRTDDGAGACELMWITDVTVVR